MQILNRHHLKQWPPGAVYVGRGTVLGNPFMLGQDGDRDAVCDQYDAWLRARVTGLSPAVMTALFGLNQNSALICSCTPARCHAISIAKAWERLHDSGLPPRRRSMAYAGIGSRRTPPEILDRMTVAAQRLARMGYTLRSGGADGADRAFELGAGENKEIYLPWRGFNGNPSPLFEPTAEALDVASALHPAWSGLKPAIKRLHARNSHQVLGSDLRSPVDFVVCWTPGAGAECEADRTPDTGGTGQAIALASRWKIPVFNFARADAGERLRDHLIALKLRD